MFIKILLLILAILVIASFIILIRLCYGYHRIKYLRGKIKELDRIDDKIIELTKNINEGKILPEEAKILIEDIEISLHKVTRSV